MRTHAINHADKRENNRLLKESPVTFHAPVLTKEIQEPLPTVYNSLAVHILLRRKCFSKGYNENLRPKKQMRQNNKQVVGVGRKCFLAAHRIFPLRQRLHNPNPLGLHQLLRRLYV